MCFNDKDQFSCIFFGGGGEGGPQSRDSDCLLMASLWL